MNRKKQTNFYLKYTVLFVFFMLFILYFYYSKGIATVNNSNDGFKQFYRALLYISNYYKKILCNIFIEHTFVIPQWDFVLGEGGDIIETFHYYGLGDPINLLSVFFNESNLYIFHDISIFIRMYLAGFVFSKLCFYEKHNNEIVVLAASILYAYSSYALRVLTNYIYFINPLIYFPLIVLGIEKLIFDNNGKILTIGVTLASITSIYFFYMIVLATVIYVAIRLLTLDFDFKTIVNKLVKIFIYSIFGVLISAVIFLPAAYSMLSNSRIGGSVSIPLFYDLDYYTNLFTYLVFNTYTGWYHGGYTVLGLFGIASVISNKGNKSLKYMLLASLIIMLLPVFGSIFNGMTYIVDRYEFFLCFLATYCIVVGYEKFSGNKKDIVICFILLCIYSAVSIYTNIDENRTYILLFALGTVALLGFTFAKNKKIKEYICLLATICSISYVILYKNSTMYWNHAGTHGTDIARLTNMHNEEPSVFNDINDDTFFRYSGNSLPDNVSVNGNKSSTGYYWSVANNNIADFRTSNGFHDETNFYITNYDGDFILNSLSGVKYYFVKEGEPIPYNYKLYKEYKDYDLYINSKSLPLFYAYDNCIGIDEYEDTFILERKELITQAVVTNEKPQNNINIESEIEEISKTVSCTEGIEITDSTIASTIPNSEIRMEYNSKVAGEYYLVIEDLYTDEEMNISITNSFDINKKILIKTENSHAYDDRHSFLINLGYYDSIADVITLGFPSESNMTFKNIGVYCLPLNTAASNIEKLNCVKINSLNISDNAINANIEVPKDKYLCMSIPNYDGWKAYIDGKEVELEEYNIMYMGFLIDKGEHNIVLNYATPLLKEGAIVSMLSIVAFVAFELLQKKKKRDLNSY